MNMKLLSLATVLAATAVSCNQQMNKTTDFKSDNKNNTQFIKPPIAGVNIAMEEMRIDPNKTNVLKPLHSAGSTITIPAGAIINPNGSAVKGKVTIKYREFHDAADLFVSGIPMEMKTNRKTEHFETAGMFEIRAEDAYGNALAVNPDMGITVRMGSFNSDSSFRFFHLDEQAQNWTYQGEADPEINTERIEIAEEIIRRTPKHKIPFDEGYHILNYFSMLDILAKNDSRMLQMLQNSPKIKEKVKALNLTQLDVSLYNEVRFNGRLYPADAIVWQAVSTTPLNGEVKNSESYYMGDKTYRFVVDYYDGRKWVGDLRAVMTIQDLFAKDASFWQEEYENAMAEVKELERRLEEKAAVYRTFEIAGFGIFNWDKFMDKGDSRPVLVHTQITFDQPLSKTEDLRVNNFFLVGPDKNSMIRLNPDVYFQDSLLIQPLPGSIIITNLEGGRLAILPAQDYNKLHAQGIRPKSSVNMHFKIMPGRIESAEDVRKALGS